MSYNTDKYLKIISDAVKGGTVSGSSNIASLKGVAIDSDRGDYGPATLRVTIAENDPNLAGIKNTTDLLSPCIDTVNNILNTNNQSVQGYTWEVGPGDNQGAAEAILGVPRVCIADNDTNLSAVKTMADELYNCIDNVNHHLEVDTNAINGVAMQVNSGNLEISAGVSGVQRVCIATDDVNLAAINSSSATVAGAVSAGKMQCEVTNNVSADILIGGLAPSTGDGFYGGVGDNVQRVVIANNDPLLSSIDGNISGMKLCFDDGEHKLRVWSDTGQVSVSGAVTLSGTSNAVNATCTGAVSLTGSTNAVNATLVTINGSTTAAVAIPTGTGVTTNTIRTNLATDDVMSLNILYSLYDHRYLSTKFLSYMMGGTIPSGQLLSSKWCCIPNDSSCTYDETNTEPQMYQGLYNYHANHSDDYGTGPGSTVLYWHFYTSVVGANPQTSNVSLSGSADTNFSSIVSTNQEIYRLYIVPDTNSQRTNTGDCIISNVSSTNALPWMMIPAGNCLGRHWSIIMPIGANRFYLDSLVCQSLDFTNANRGFRVKIELWISYTPTGDVLQTINLFETQILHSQSVTFDLSSIPIVQVLAAWPNTTGSSRSSIHLFVKGGNYGDGSSSPTSASCYLNCKVSRT